MIEFKCTKCGQDIRVNEAAAGKYGQCPKCQAKLLVPERKMVTLEAADKQTPPPVKISSPQPPKPEPNKANNDWKWILAAIIVALAVAIYFHKTALTLGILLLILCGLFFVPQCRGALRRILRINPDKKSDTVNKIAACVGVGILLIVLGSIGLKIQAGIDESNRMIEAGNKEVANLVKEAKAASKERDFELAYQKLNQAGKVEHANNLELILETRPIITNANVNSLMIEAREALEVRNFNLANIKLREANGVKHATNLGQVKAMQARVANEQVKDFVANAKNAIEKDDFEVAKAQLQAAISIPHTTAVAEAKKLREQVNIGTDPKRIRKILDGFSDEKLQQLQEAGDVPPQLISGYKNLDAFAAKLVKQQIPDIIAVREKRHQEQLAKEEAKRKAEEEKKNPFPHEVMQSETFLEYKLSLDVRLLPSKGIYPTKKQLEKLAKYLYAKYGGSKYQRVFMCYYLPNMKVDAGAWATTHYNPSLEVRILGNIQQEPLPISAPAWKSLKAKCQYRFTGKFPLMPVHPDGLEGKTATETLDKVAKMKTVATGPDGISVYILMVRPATSTKTPWYFVKANEDAGWINSIALQNIKIKKE